MNCWKWGKKQCKDAKANICPLRCHDLKIKKKKEKGEKL
jgi:hypothetical protein